MQELAQFGNNMERDWGWNSKYKRTGNRTSSHKVTLWLGGLSRAFYNAVSCSQKYCKSLNLEMDCKLVLNGPQTPWPLFIEVFVSIWQYQEPNIFLVKYISVFIVPAIPGCQLDNLAAWMRDSLLTTFLILFLCLLSWIQFYFFLDNAVQGYSHQEVSDSWTQSKQLHWIL